MPGEFPIGTEYMTRGKHPRKCRVIDVWKTYNSAGELVHTRYVTEHEFCSQMVREFDVVQTTIAMGRVTP
jgi:hypothetical protein